MTSFIDIILKIISTFFNENPISLFFNILNVLYFIPAVLAILNFRFVRSYDYLIIVGMLLGNAISTLLHDVVLIDEMFIFFLPLAQILLVIAFFLTSFGMVAYWLHAIRLKWKTVPKILWYGFWCFAIVNNVLLSIYLALVDLGVLTPDPTLMSIRSILWSSSIMGIGLFYIYTYQTYSKVIEYKPVKNAIWLWQFTGACWALLGGTMTLQRLIILHKIQGVDWFLTLPFYEIFWIPAAVFILITTFRYPEALLISEVQIQRACKLYSLIEQYTDKQLPQPTHWGFDRIIDYINSIPPSIFEERCKEDV